MLINFDLYLVSIIFYDLYEKFYQKLYIYFEFKYLIFKIMFFFKIYNNMSLNWLYSKIFYMLRAYLLSFLFIIKKGVVFNLKRINKQYYYKYFGFMFNNFDFFFFFDYFRFYFRRIYFKYRQLVGLSSMSNLLKIKFKFKLYIFVLYLNDLNSRLNNLLDALIKRYHFIYFYENYNLLYELFLCFFGMFNFLKIYLSFFGFFFINFKVYIKKYKNFNFYTTIL